MKIYLSGPMKGYEEKNYPLFNKVAKELRDAGHEVYNPAEYTYVGDVFPIREAFSEYSWYICNQADAIVLLPGWNQSQGATAEYWLAKNCMLHSVLYSGHVIEDLEEVSK